MGMRGVGRELRHPLVVTVLLATVLFAALAFAVGDVRESSLNAPVVAIVILAAFGFILLQVLFTGWRDWTVMGAGLLLFFVAVVLLFIHVGIGIWGNEAERSDLWLSASRACFAVGGVASVIGAGLKVHLHGRVPVA